MLTGSRNMDGSGQLAHRKTSKGGGDIREGDRDGDREGQALTEAQAQIQILVQAYTGTSTGNTGTARCYCS